MRLPLLGLLFVLGCNTTKDSFSAPDPHPTPSGTAAAVLATTTTTSAASATTDDAVTREPRVAADFHAISASGTLDVQLTIGSPIKVVVEAEARLLPQIKTEVMDGVLTISERGEIRTSHPIRVTVVAPNVDAITQSGTGTFTARGLSSASLTATSSGTGTMSLVGNADRAKLTASGTGTLNAKDLTAKTVDALTSGTGNVTLTASDTLGATISGVGSIDVYGHPANVTKHISGVGRVNVH